MIGSASERAVMPPRQIQTFAGLLAARSYTEIARRLLDLELESNGMELASLMDDPFGALEEHPGIEVAYEPATGDNCSVAGYFRETTDPPTLVVHPSGTIRRDAFTVLHEYGHYVQLVHEDWANVLLMKVDAAEYVQINEKIADEFASEVLMPASILPMDPAAITARQLREHYESQSFASRSALAYRCVAGAQAGTRLMVIVLADLGSSIIFGHASGDLMTPARGVGQLALQGLVRRATESDSGLAFEQSHAQIVARSGWIQTDLKFDAAVDDDGYAFVVGRPAQRFGAAGWVKESFICSNPSCESQFDIDESLVRCRKCGEWRCPDCNECSCRLSSRPTCPECFVQLSPAEATGDAVHDC